MSLARLLLVDDDPELGLIVGVLARKAGQALSCRPDVESAWAALAESRPELVLLDLELPGASGLDLLRRARADAGLSGLRVALFCQSGLAARVAAAYRRHRTNRIVAESNNGGEMVADVLRQCDANLPVRLVTATRGHADVVLGASPRGTLALFRAAQARAYAQGRDYVTPDDVQALLTPVLGHRLALTAEARHGGRAAARVLEDVVQKLRVPS